jgi:hypothetical protein
MRCAGCCLLGRARQAGKLWAVGCRTAELHFGQAIHEGQRADLSSEPCTDSLCTAVLQIVVGPPYDSCTSLHNDEAAMLRVKKVVRTPAWLLVLVVVQPSSFPGDVASCMPAGFVRHLLVHTGWLPACTSCSCSEVGLSLRPP